jgi:integrase
LCGNISCSIDSSNKKAHSTADFFYCVVQNDIVLKGASTLTAAVLVSERVPHLLFRFSDGYQPPSLNGTFKRLMRDTGLLKNEDGQNRTLYSLRHTYATFELLRGGTDIHTLSKQMGNSAAMIERHYSKLTATMAADRLA